MKRKLIRQANQAYTITLPVEWVRKHNLSAKSEIDMEINEKSLVISTSSGVEGKRESLLIKDWQGRTIRNYILSLYAKGVDEIKVRSESDISKELLRAMNNLVGFAIVSQENNEYVIKDLNHGTYQNLDEIFKRVFQMILMFYESAINDIFGKEEEVMDSLQARDREVNKFCLYLQRAINKSSYQDIVRGRALFTFSFALEKIGDEVERLWRTNVKYRPKKPKELRVLAELSKEGLGMSFDLFYRFSPKLMEELYAMREKVRENSLKIKFNDPNSFRMARHIIKIIEDAVDLNHLTIMMK